MTCFRKRTSRPIPRGADLRYIERSHDELGSHSGIVDCEISHRISSDELHSGLQTYSEYANNPPSTAVLRLLRVPGRDRRGLVTATTLVRYLARGLRLAFASWRRPPSPGLALPYIP